VSIIEEQQVRSSPMPLWTHLEVLNTAQRLKPIVNNFAASVSKTVVDCLSDIQRWSQYSMGHA
jgi:hypothetical protein